MSSGNPPNHVKAPKPVRRIATMWAISSGFFTLTGTPSLLAGLLGYYVLETSNFSEKSTVDSFPLDILPFAIVGFFILFGILSYPMAVISFLASRNLKKMKRRGIFYSNLISLFLFCSIALPFQVIASFSFFSILILLSDLTNSASYIFGCFILLVTILMILLVTLSMCSLGYLNRKDIRIQFS